MRQEDRMMAAVGCVDWELVEAAAAPAGRRRLPRRARVGLIAACLCLLLAYPQGVDSFHANDEVGIGADDG